MKKKFLFLLLLLSLNIIEAQPLIHETRADPFNFVLLIEGHLAENGLGAVKFSVNSKEYCFIFSINCGLIKVLDNADYHFDYKYIIDSIIDINTTLLTKDDFSIFKFIPDTTIIHVSFIESCEFDSSKDKRIIYKISEKADLFSIWDVVTITSFNNTCDNYFVCAIPGGSAVRYVMWEEKYGDIEEFYKKVLRGIEHKTIGRVKP